MTTNVEYALMAGHAYLGTRDRLNWFPVPQGWSEFNHRVMPGGFEAVSSQRGSEIVISYAGTGPGLSDWDANSGLALGFGSEQLRQAALYYLEVKSANPGATISFTGHSLGGGLAALMGVLFDEQAVTFDQAPFANSASTAIRDDLITYLQGQGYSDSQLAALAPELLSYDGYGTRTANVTGYFVQGEALQLIQPPFSTIGAQAMLAQNSMDLGLTGSISLHSQALLTAFLENDTFRAITFKLPELLKMVFDRHSMRMTLAIRTTRSATSSNTSSATNPAFNDSVAADVMLDRFTADLQKVAQDGGFTLTNPTSPTPSWPSPCRCITRTQKPPLRARLCSRRLRRHPLRPHRRSGQSERCQRLATVLPELPCRRADPRRAPDRRTAPARRHRLVHPGRHVEHDHHRRCRTRPSWSAASAPTGWQAAAKPTC